MNNTLVSAATEGDGPAALDHDDTGQISNVTSSSVAETGSPVLVGLGGRSQPLVRVPLNPTGRGQFDEAWLQRVIHEHPACLPIQDIEPGLDHFTSICRELRTPHGYVDVHWAPNEKTFSLYVNGKPLRLHHIIVCSNEWIEPIRHFIDAVAKADAEAG